MRRLGLLLWFALVLTGCQIDVQVAFDLHEDGTGDIDVRIETDAEFERIYGFTNRAFEDLIATRGAETGLPFEVVELDDGNIYRASRRGVGLAELEQIAMKLAPGLGNVDFSARQEGVAVDATLGPLPDADDLAALFTVFDPSELEDDVTVEVAIIAPGDVRVSTADSSDGGRYVWTIPMARQSKNVLLETDLNPEGGGPSVPWGPAIVVLVVVVSIMFLTSIRTASRQLGEEESDPQTKPASEPRREAEPEEEAPQPEAVLAGEDLDN